MRLMLHFARTYPGEAATMVLSLLIAGIIEGVGLSALLPMLNIALAGQDKESASGIGALASSMLKYIGVQPTVETLLLMVVVAVLLKGVCLLFADKKVGYTVSNVATGLRLDLLTAILGVRWEYYVTQTAGRLVNAATTEVIQASQAYLHGAIAVMYFIQAVVYGVMAVLVSWQAALTAFAAGSALLFLLNGLVRKTKKAGRKQTLLLQSLASRLMDSLQSIKPLRSMGREDLAESLLRADSISLNTALRKQVLSKAMLKSLQEPIIMLFVTGGLYITLVLWKLVLSEVMMLVFLLARLLGLLGKFQQRQQDMAACEAAYWALIHRIEDAKARQDTSSGKKKVLFTRRIRLDSVTFCYDDRFVLQDASIEIPAGSMILIIGPSGVGKTTIIDLITGLLRPSAGRILIDDIPLSEIDLGFWRRQIGYVPQETVLLHDTVFANVQLGDPELDEKDVEEALRAAGAWDFVASMPGGLHAVVGERGAKLSGGQRQRIAIARALSHGPRLLILDEATSALDPENEQAICATLSRLRGQITILAISHQPALAEVADQVFGVKNGKIIPRPQV